MMLGCGLCFFFQAEDGIRDLVRSRGLGDVYKRQRGGLAMATIGGCAGFGAVCGSSVATAATFGRISPVSYTHLTLPTSDLV